MECRTFLGSVEEISVYLNDERCDEKKLQEYISSVLMTFESGTVEKCLSCMDASSKESIAAKIHLVVIKLWNGTVAKYSGKLISVQLNCLLRQLCFDLACLAESSKCKGTGKNEIKRTVTMGIKVGKAWLEAAKHDYATAALEKTKAKITSLTQIAAKEGNTTWADADKLGLEKDYFAVLCALVEVMISRGCIKEAEELIDEASRASFISAPEAGSDCMEIEKLCSLTFNCGLSLANEMKYSDSIRWLKKSYEAGKCGNCVKASILGRILRLTGHCYAELRTADGDQSAMNALELARNYISHPAGLLLKLKILSKNNTISNDTIDPSLKEFLVHSDVTIDLALECCRHLNDNGRLVLCERAMEHLLDKYSNSSQVSRVYAKRFEYNLERLENDEAVEFTRDFLRGANIIQDMDQQSKMCVQLVLWKRAEQCQVKGESMAVLAWYDLSATLFQLCEAGSGNSDDVKANMAKLHRNRSSCLLSMGKTEEALNSALEASKLEPDNPRSDFALFNIAMHQGKEEEAICRIERVTENCSIGMDVDGSETEKENLSIHGLVCLCAQTAFEKETLPVARKALQCVQRTATNRIAKLIALRCLVRLTLKTAQDSLLVENQGHAPDIQAVLDEACYTVGEALKVLTDVSSRPLNDNEVESRRDTALSSQTDKTECTNELVQDEADWFMKICWNMAIEAKAYSHLMKRLFKYCYQFLCLLEEDDAVLTRQKTCLLMSCAASLDLARKSDSYENMKNNFHFALEQIGLHKCIESRLASIQDAESIHQQKEIVLRSLYELEAILKITPTEKLRNADFSSSNKLQEIQELINSMLLMPRVTVNTLETMAALCTEPPANHPQLSKLILKEAIARLSLQIHSGGDNEEGIQVSSRICVFYRALIELTLRQGTGVDCISKDEALTLLREVLTLVEEKLKDSCPEEEILWLMINGWNVGARLYVAEFINKAEKWLSTSMRFLAHLKNYKTGYEDHMNETYMEVLSKKDSIARSARLMEIS